MAKVTVIVNTLLMNETATVEVEHENVSYFRIGEYNGVLTVIHEDNSQTCYARGIWREADWSPTP